MRRFLTTCALIACATLAVTAAPRPAQAQDGLTRAYQKEFTFLEAEKAALQARKDKVQAEARRDEIRLSAEIAGLQRRLIAMRERADNLDAELREASDAAARSETSDDIVGEVLLRAGDTLRKYGLEPPPAVATTTDGKAGSQMGDSIAGAAALVDGAAARRRDKQTSGGADNARGLAGANGHAGGPDGGAGHAVPADDNGREPDGPGAGTAADAARGDADVAAGVSRDQALHIAFTRGLELLDRNGSVSVVDGEFFLADGNKVSGKVVHMGGIATWGVTAETGGPLLPAGAGHLSLMAADPTVARALAAGERPALLPLFLHEALDKPMQPAAEKTLGDFLRSGGIIGWVIVGLGFLVVIMLIVRSTLLAMSSGGSRMVAQVEQLVCAGRRQDALATAKSARGPAGRVLVATLTHLEHEREQLEDMVSEALLGEQSKLERFSAAITASAAVAPLLGLLGTVAGMIATFDIITEHGTGDPKMLSGGISEALVTTELGLIVAIPTLLIGSVLIARADAITTALERAALRVMNAAAMANLNGPAVSLPAGKVRRATAPARKAAQRPTRQEPAGNAA